MTTPRVLLTGANGFLGLHILSQLLEAGYSVRCVVRSQDKANLILRDFPNQTSLIDVAIVPDMTIPGAFDATVQSTPPFTTVIHQASPFFFASITNNVEFLDPAIKGTTSLLNSIKSFAPDVKRVIYTSSCAAIVDRTVPDVQVPRKTYTEDDWNPMSYEDAVNGNKGDAYRASKKFAEQAAWDFIKEEKPNFDLVSINPPMIFGPFLPQTATRLKIKDLNESNARVYNGYINTSKDAGLPHNALNVYVDVRDLATSHIKAITTPDAGGQRFIVSAREIPAQRICDLLREKFPELAKRTPVGQPGTNDIAEGSYLVANDKVVKTLGLVFRSDKECFLELGRQLLDIEKAS
jgi:nucleoside-diphosphate-sugar epimerase